jgi:hypothetical protein
MHMCIADVLLVGDVMRTFRGVRESRIDGAVPGPNRYYEGTYGGQQAFFCRGA